MNTFPTNSTGEILAYLETRLPGYPFSPQIDPDFVNELLDDFPDVPVLEEIKAFRWYHENDPANRVANIRLAIRRWITKASPRSYP
jgi:hypothetical protein